jgi:uncharacterized protein YqjF (DUF2071 family)
MMIRPFVAGVWLSHGLYNTLLGGSRRVLTGVRVALRRHPIPIEAHFRDCLTLTFALPEDVLKPLLPPGLELETVDGQGFVAVALVQTENLRPAHAPHAVGRDFFLAGYRIFARFRTTSGRRLRGLRILRSDADRATMVVVGNLLTHYNYRRCAAAIAFSQERIDVSVRTADGRGDLDVSARPGDRTLPAGSPFRSIRAARRFAGPLPFTFDYEPETHAIVAIQASRANWRPEPVAVDVRRIAFFEQPPFCGCRPRLAAAFHVSNIDYRWHRGVRHAL